VANSTQQAESQQILSGWKEIANHLGRGVRTVQRYERDLGLPVRRPTRESVVVFAITSEIDAWVEACPMRATIRSMATTPKSSAEATVQTLKKNVQEMQRLGKQMRELKGGLRYSLEMLRTSLRFVETDAHAEPQPSASGLATSLEALGMRTNSIRSNQTSVPRS
jgi:predicted DNA-binding transcriptional regulator AlpA